MNGNDEVIEQRPRETEPHTKSQITDLLREQMAAAIHQSRPGATPWDRLPHSPANPQRHSAYRSADAVIALFSPGRRDIEDVLTAMGTDTESVAEANAAVRRFMSEGGVTVVNDGTGEVKEETLDTLGHTIKGLCNINGCVLMPHDEKEKHSWEK